MKGYQTSLWTGRTGNVTTAPFDDRDHKTIREARQRLKSLGYSHDDGNAAKLETEHWSRHQSGDYTEPNARIINWRSV